MTAELDELRAQVEELVGAPADPWWEGVVALRTGELTLERLAKALDALRGAPPIATGGARGTLSRSVALRFVERGLRYGRWASEGEMRVELSGIFDQREITEALVNLAQRGIATPKPVRSAPRRGGPPRELGDLVEPFRGAPTGPISESKGKGQAQ